MEDSLLEIKTKLNENLFKIKKDSSLFKVNLNISKLSKFLDREIVIYNKFPPKTTNSYTSEKMTQLFINYLEEYYEFLEAKDKLVTNLNDTKMPVTIESFLNKEENINEVAENYKDFLFELIDMICYIGTMAIVYNSNNNTYYMTEFNNDNLSLNFDETYTNPLFLKNKNFVYNKNEIVLNKSKNLLNFIKDNIRNSSEKIKKIHSDFEINFLELRRLYPERKWHKVKDPLDKDIEYDLIGSKIEELCIKTDIELIYQLLNLNIGYLFIDNDDKISNEMNYNSFLELLFNKTFEMIYDKQEVTINL